MRFRDDLYAIKALIRWKYACQSEKCSIIVKETTQVCHYKAPTRSRQQMTLIYNLTPMKLLDYSNLYYMSYVLRTAVSLENPHHVPRFSMRVTPRLFDFYYTIL